MSAKRGSLATNAGFDLSDLLCSSIIVSSDKPL